MRMPQFRRRRVRVNSPPAAAAAFRQLGEPSTPRGRRAAAAQPLRAPESRLPHGPTFALPPAMRLSATAALAAAAAAAAASLAATAVARAEPSLVEPARVAAAFAPAAPSPGQPGSASTEASRAAAPAETDRDASSADAARLGAPAGASRRAAAEAGRDAGPPDAARAEAAPADAATAIAPASPSPVASSPPATAIAPASLSLVASSPPASAIAYLEPGVAIGGTSDGLYGAVHLDGGGRLVGPLWLHARLAQGDVAIINLAASSAPLLSSFTEARLGLELRGCRATGQLCLFGGVDAGYALQTFQRAGDMSTRSDGPSVATATAHLGLEVGGRALRLRTSVEAARGQGDWGTGGVTLGVARTW